MDSVKCILWHGNKFCFTRCGGSQLQLMLKEKLLTRDVGGGEMH